MKEWHSWHYSTWFRETSTCLASANGITVMRWWGNPSVFPSVVCLIARACVCVSIIHQSMSIVPCRQWVGVFAVFMCGYCVWPEWSLYSRHVVHSLLSESLLPASVVYLCSLQEVWLEQHDWPTGNWPDRTPALEQDVYNQQDRDNLNLPSKLILLVLWQNNSFSTVNDSFSLWRFYIKSDFQLPKPYIQSSVVITKALKKV